ncbi:MAG: hypothetical protein BAJATHORv1_20645 [Candidatus Thorarchaeota archaeon]|nr:MAG: hypothetical protein BAJATHORv1_20645 [Candidatus Thorarchaeota archaeon]
MILEQSPKKTEALKILDALDIMDYLNSYGDARVVGSVALDLIVKLDLDVHVLLLLKSPMELAQEIIPILLSRKGVREIRLTDYRQSNEGLKIGIDSYPSMSGTWSIDIWLTEKVYTTGFLDVLRLSHRITLENRKTILKLKWHYHQRGKLRDGISKEIYEAVIYHDVKSVGEFEAYRKTSET